MQVERLRNRIHSSIRRAAIHREGGFGVRRSLADGLMSAAENLDRCFLAHPAMLSTCGRQQAAPQFSYACTCWSSGSRRAVLRDLLSLFEEDADGARGDG